VVGTRDGRPEHGPSCRGYVERVAPSLAQQSASSVRTLHAAGVERERAHRGAQEGRGATAGQGQRCCRRPRAAGLASRRRSSSAGRRAHTRSSTGALAGPQLRREKPGGRSAPKAMFSRRWMREKARTGRRRHVASWHAVVLAVEQIDPERMEQAGGAEERYCPAGGIHLIPSGSPWRRRTTALPVRRDVVDLDPHAATPVYSLPQAGGEEGRHTAPEISVAAPPRKGVWCR